MTHCIINGRLTPATEAAISIQDRGFKYGDGVFETIAIHAGVPYQYDWHMQRLARGLAAIRIPFAVETLREQCRQLLAHNHATQAILRIQITRGNGGRGYLPDANTTPNVVITTIPAPILLCKPVTLWQSHYAKVSPAALPVQYKLCQGLNSTLARLEAEENQCTDALMLNDKRQLCETSSANIFWIKGGHLYTPELSCGALEGSTRAALLRLAPVRETIADLDTLLEADAVFVTNSVWKTLAVNQLLPVNARWDSEAAAQHYGALLLQDRDDDSRAHREQWKPTPSSPPRAGI